MSECSHGLYTPSIEELLSGREIKEDRDDQQVRRHPVQMHAMAGKINARQNIKYEVIK